jgi:hypothetical protein
MENHHILWVNKLFRLGHGFQFANCKRLKSGRVFSAMIISIWIIPGSKNHDWMMERWGLPPHFSKRKAPNGQTPRII